MNVTSLLEIVFIYCVQITYALGPKIFPIIEVKILDNQFAHFK